MAIQIMIDSASDITQKEAQQLGITVIPMTVTIDGKEYLDGVDLSPHAFYEKLIESDALPKTGQVTPYRFSQALEGVLRCGDEVLILTLSAKLSGTYSAAVTASACHGDRVRVVDSKSACIGERLLCQYALSCLAQTPTLTLRELADMLEQVRDKIQVIAMLNTLEFLKKGGRISSAVAFAGELIGLKPVIAIVDGEVALLGKARGSKNGGNLLTELVDRRGGIDFSKPYGAVMSGSDQTMLNKYLKDHAYLWESATCAVPTYLLGATIGTHIGPGAIGVAFFSK